MTDCNKRRTVLGSLLEKAHQDSYSSTLISESMGFEDCIIQSSRSKGSFSREWVEAEIRKSSDYFTKEIYKTI